MRYALQTDAAVVLHERSLEATDPAVWDRCVQASGGSFLGCWSVLKAESVLRTVRVFEFHRGGSPASSTRIGQCAVAVSNDRLRFLDRLHLLPAYADHWADALQQVVARCGAGIYTYGSGWNHERCRASLAGALVPEGGVVDGAFGLDCVDFAAWPDFGAYRRGVSENIRRDYKKAAAASPTVITRRGMAAWRDVPGLVSLRRQVMQRNGERFSSFLDGPKHALKLLCLGDDAFISTIEAQGRLQAAFFGVRFGGGIYYLGGGTRDGCEGFGSYMFLTLLEGWFRDHPDGKLYLGMTQPGVLPEMYTRGNLLYRRKLRARSIPACSFTLYVR